jgi:hypothetical protein
LRIIDKTDAELSRREAVFEWEDLSHKRGLGLITDVVGEGDVREDLVSPC